MTNHRVRVVEQLENTTIIQAPACQTCTGCAAGKFKTVQIPGAYNNQVELHLKLEDLAFVLANSLMLPLALGLISAFVADLCHSSEIYGIISFLCGFTLGMLLCRRLKESAVTVKEV